MTKDLYIFTKSDRLAANARLNDPEGWKSAQSQNSLTLRLDIRRMTEALKAARLNPDDPDCAALLDMLDDIDCLHHLEEARKAAREDKP